MKKKKKDVILKSVQDEKDYYKSRATEAKEDLDRVKSELDYLRRALDSENRSLVNELAELRIKTSSAGVVTETAIDIPMPQQDLILNSIVEMNIPEPPVHDFWSQSRLRQRNYKKKGRTVQDLHEVCNKKKGYIYKWLIRYIQSSASTSFVITSTNKDLKIMNRKDDKIINNTVTFALYTVAIYFFGIVTSTFLMEGGSNAAPWEQALVAATTGQIPKSKVLEIILYWLEKLLFEPQGLPVS